MSLDPQTLSRLRSEWDGRRNSSLPPAAPSMPPPIDEDLLDFYVQRALKKAMPHKDSGARELRLPPLAPVGLPERKSSMDAWLIFSDAHIPFEKKEYLDLVIEIGRTLRPHGIAIIGDWGDLLSVSSHPKLPHQLQWQLKDECEAVNERLDQVDAIGAKDRRFFTGNHDIRGQRTALRQMVGLYESLDPAYLYNLKKRGWISYPYQQHALVGKLNLVHDCGHSGKYAVWQNADAFGASTVQGHVHNAGVQYFGSVLGDRHISATVGWLGDDKYAEYMAPIKRTRNWQHAFGWAYVERDTQNTHMQVVPIIEGRAVVEGQLFEAAK